jgi:beta-galactosidase
MRSCYNLSDAGWLAVATRPWMGGAFVWTGFDYKGEPNPYGWPDISNNTGLLDVCGFPKDKAYFFKSCWTTEPMVHLVPSSWNWPGKEGQAIRVLAFSNAKQVELFLNGKSLGTKEMPKDSHAEWQVPYEPGTLMAKASTDGKLVASDELQTTDAPARIQLTTDRTTLRPNGQDAVVVAVSILDSKGRLVPNADKRVSFQLAGGGRILGVGNGNPADHDTDKADNRNTFHGHCIAVIQGGSQPAEIRLTASSPGLAADHITFKVQ